MGLVRNTIVRCFKVLDDITPGTTPRAMPIMSFAMPALSSLHHAPDFQQPVFGFNAARSAAIAPENWEKRNTGPRSVRGRHVQIRNSEIGGAATMPEPTSHNRVT